METIIPGIGLNLARQSFLGDESEEILHRTRVGIVGLGGGGSHIAQQLAHVGMGNFLLLDADRIEDTNLNRLVGGRASDVKRQQPKVYIARRLIKAVNSSATVIAKVSPWQEHTALIQEREVVFGCIDSLAGRSELEAFARRSMIPLIDIGMDVNATASGFVVSGQVALSLPGMPCLRCMGLLNEHEMKQEAERYGKAGARPQVVWPNAVLASTAVGYVMQLITPWQTHLNPFPLMEYDGNKQTVTPSNKTPYFPEHCRHFEGIDNLGDPFWAAA